MSIDDQKRWDARYGAADADYIMGTAPKAFVDWLWAQPWCPTKGRALDLAAGEGQTAVALAQHGLEAHAWDISSVGLAKAERLANHRSVRVQTRVVDLEALPTTRPTQPPPDALAAPYDVVTVLHYKQASLAPWIRERLAAGGIVAIELAGLKNLQKSPHPSARFLVEDDEIERWFTGLEVLHRSALWRGDRYLVRFVGRAD